MVLVHSLTEFQICRLHELYQNEWWSKGRSLQDTRVCISRSSIIFGVVEGDDLIGFARVLSDYIFKAFIFDVIVDPDHRDKGIGKFIIKSIMSHIDLSAVKHFELYCRSDIIPYYQSLGFTDDLGDVNLMRLMQNKI